MNAMSHISFHAIANDCAGSRHDPSASSRVNLMQAGKSVSLLGELKGITWLDYD